jgi:hypothetical protein
METSVLAIGSFLPVVPLGGGNERFEKAPAPGYEASHAGLICRLEHTEW